MAQQEQRSALGGLIRISILSGLIGGVCLILTGLALLSVLNESLDIVSIIGFVVIFIGFVLLKREAISSEIDSIKLRMPSE